MSGIRYSITANGWICLRSQTRLLTIIRLGLIFARTVFIHESFKNPTNETAEPGFLKDFFIRGQD